MSASNLPPGVSGGSFATELHLECSAGHRWVTPARTELGATWLVDEDDGGHCPQCGLPDNDNLDIERVHPDSITATYEVDEHDVWWDSRIMEAARAEAEWGPDEILPPGWTERDPITGEVPE